MNLLYTDGLSRRVYIASMSAAGFFLPLSEWLLTLSIIFIVLSVILLTLTRGYRRGNSLYAFTAIFLVSYLVHIIWMTNTSEVLTGLTTLRLKLPLIIFPVAVTLFQPFDKREFKLIISFFIAGVVVASFAGMIARYDEVLSGEADRRELSIFVSHIRLSLMTLFAAVASGWIYYTGEKRFTELPYLLVIPWLLSFLFILMSFTGIVLLAVVLAVILILILFHSKNNIVRYIVLSALVAGPAGSVFYFSKEYNSFNKDPGLYPVPLESLTAAGNQYMHFPDRPDRENGSRVWIYISEEEMRSEWNRRSGLNYDGNDSKGQTIRFTIIRYLTSCGLRKDSAGIASLEEGDIRAIERGYTNRIFTERRPLKSKIYELIWQIDYYKNGGNPSGHSVTQRVEFFKTGLRVFSTFPFTGTGTGDIKMEYRKRYEADGSILDPEYRLTPHNQYLTFLVSFGITGFLVILGSFFLPLFLTGAYRHFLPAIFAAIIFLSMLWEDTLETHTGVSFFAYFYAFLIFGRSDE